MLKFFKRIAYIIPRWFNFLKQKKLILNFFVDRNWRKLTDNRKRVKILANNRKSHHSIETLLDGKLCSTSSLLSQVTANILLGRTLRWAGIASRVD